MLEAFLMFILYMDAAMQRIPLVKGDYECSTMWKFYPLGLIDLESFVHNF